MKITSRVWQETKGFTTQSLALVAFQINTLASNMLNMLDTQAVQLANMESSSHSLLTFTRRKIGLFTATKNVTRNLRLTYPSIPDCAVKYIKKPLEFT